MGRENQANKASTASQGDSDRATLEAENASLQDRLLRALADAYGERSGV
jgi:hypothetical protein